MITQKNEKTKYIFTIEFVKKVCYHSLTMENKKKNITFEHKKEFHKHFIYAMYNQKKIGYAWFSIHEGDAFLSYITVNKKYRNCHVGSALLDCVEIICRENRVDRIEGKFYPEIDGKIVRAFYEKNGYMHYREDYEQYIGKWFYLNEKIPKQEIIEKE